ncbi:NADH:ubiquinone oxidoreductase [Basidiobolus ranarum]|uniref:NADH:ubiquinone oxidoreductase n=1 Tax=Basidiobolus ranarum TaxID=34480 RepID=A0ABR2VMK2_9FUNG
MPELSFPNPKEEITYWRNMTISLEKELSDTRLALDEFQASSIELEEELERELHTLEVQNKKLKIQNQGLVFELDVLQQKQKVTSLDSNQSIVSLQKELETLREGYARIQRKAVDLEMDNEELESFKRVAHSSMADMEKKCKETREWKMKFEQETAKCNQMKEEMQRLKDELRDLENELSVVRLKSPVSPALSPTPSNSPPSPTPCKNVCDNANHTEFHSHSQSSTPPSPLPTAHKFSEHRRKEGNPIATIQEIMERVKILESRLISCRSIVSPLLPNLRFNSNATAPSSPDLIPRSKKIVGI